MMEPTLLTVLVSGFCILALVIVMVVITARADHECTIKGPLARIEVLNQQILDLEKELEKRREAIAHTAEDKAEVDALMRQKDELLAEWSQLDERRQEVSSIRKETEDAQAALAEVTRDLREKAEELELVEERLKRAEELIVQIKDLDEKRARLEQEVAKRQEELSNLQSLQANERELRDIVERLERDTARLIDETEHLKSRREQAETSVKQAEADHEKINSQNRIEAAQLASKQTELSRVERQRAELLAQIEELRVKAGGIGGGQDGDPLRELEILPRVLENLRQRSGHSDTETENDVLLRVAERIENSGLEYHRRVIRAFHTAMKVNETTQMAVLAGISGTGKSQLPRSYAHAMGIGFLQIPVQPRWDSPQDLMGFYNYIEGKFRPTDLARALYHLDELNGPEDTKDLRDRMMLVLLDEMNLARVEYYFSDFLSRLENRPDIGKTDDPQARKDAELELDVQMPKGRLAPRIFPGYNLLFAGTMNEDESTQSLSDKVVDRANVMRFAAPKTIKVGKGQLSLGEFKPMTRTQWRKWVKGVDTLGDDSEQVESHVGRLVDIMADLGRPFGHRLGRAMMAYAANYPEANGRRDLNTAVADQVEMRLLPKLRGVEVDNVSGALDKLSKFVADDLNDPALADAIKHSKASAENGTGQFVWRGVTRE